MGRFIRNKAFERGLKTHVIHAPGSPEGGALGLRTVYLSLLLSDIQVGSEESTDL